MGIIIYGRRGYTQCHVCIMHPPRHEVIHSNHLHHITQHRRFTSIKATYSFAQVWLAGCLISPLFITERWGAFGFIVALGLPWATTMALPFTLVALNTQPGETGLYMGVLNIFVVVPQLIVALGFGVIVEQFGIKPVFLIGAMASIICE